MVLKRADVLLGVCDVIAVALIFHKFIVVCSE